MKKSLRRFAGVRYLFAGITLASFLLTAGFSALTVWIARTFFHVNTGFSAPLYYLLVSLIFGGIAAFVIDRTLLRPVAHLDAALQEVTAGNFELEIQPKSRIPAIRKTFENFNLMVRELSRTETLQTDFVSNVSHEFKTPITAIEGYAALLQDRTLTEEEQEQYVEKILFNTHRLSTLVGNILLLSRVDNQSLSQRLAEFRLDEQIRQALVDLESRWLPRDIDFDVELEGVRYKGYESLLYHVWSNLLSNAIKFSPQGGRITLRLCREEGQLRFTISDEGPGLRPEEKERIFHRFYQADSSHRAEGNGLGLALAERVVKLSGGSIGVESEEGQGCLFTVLLPCPEEAED